MIVAAKRLGRVGQSGAEWGRVGLTEQWGKFRDGLIAGLDTSLKCIGHCPRSFMHA